MRKTLEERKVARREKCEKAAHNFGIEIGRQDSKAELLIVRWLTRKDSMVRRMASLDAKIAAFRKRCDHSYAYDAGGRCVKCGQKPPGWIDSVESVEDALER